jgi:hypothetical protein
MPKIHGLIFIVSVLFVAISATLFTPPETARAIPAFARKYQMSCTTCHAPFPRLKAYGDEFAANGFVLKDKEAPRYFIPTGDEHLELIRDLPLAFRLEGWVQYQTASDRDVDFTAPYNLKLLSGGNIAKHVSYYFYFFLSERGEVAGIEDAFIMFNNLFNTELDAYLGQFQISDPLFKRELRLTYEDFEIYRTTVGESNINLTYDRGLMLTYGFPSKTDVVFEVLNGSGIGPANDEFKTYDNDKYKNFALRLSQEIVPQFRLGGFGFYGKENDINPDRAWMVGPDCSISYRDIAELNLQYMERRDNNPFFAFHKPDEFETRGGFAELVILPYGDRSRWYGVVLYNQVDSDYDPADYQTITGHIGYLLQTNLRFTAENTYDLENEENRFMVGFVTAF